MFHVLTVTITIFVTIRFIVSQEQRALEQIETTSRKNSLNDRYAKYLGIALAKKTMGTSNLTNNGNDSTISKFPVPPMKLLSEYLRCRQLSSSKILPASNWCPYEHDDNLNVCWRATENGSFTSTTIEYEHFVSHSYEEILHQIENCTIQRFCQSNGTWARTISPNIQCKTCLGTSPLSKFNEISIILETVSLSICLVSLTIALLCMINVKRLHFPRNLLHMHLFFAFICRSIIKLIFIHTIIAGYPRWMLEYTTDHCGNIDFISKSTNIFLEITCRLLSSLYWYTDAVSQTFIFCEAMFLFTALTSHLFRDRGCLLFVLWAWLSPLVWLTMWIASHIITDRIQNRSTCWLENDKTAQFLYFFHVPYVCYLFVNCGIFVYLVRLLYKKYQSANVQNNRSAANRHLIKSIFILIPLFGLHLLFTIGPFYKQGQGPTSYYYFVIIFKAIFGDLQGFFTSLIYFYLNTEIRQEVIRQIQRSLLSTDTIRRGSNGETLANRFQFFQFSSNQNRIRGRRIGSRSSQSVNSNDEVCWKKFIRWLCPCRLNFLLSENFNDDQRKHRNEILLKPMETNCLTSPSVVPTLTIDDETGRTGIVLSKTSTIERDGTTCDTLLMKNEHESDGLLSDENEVTFHQTSFTADQLSVVSSSTPVPTRNSRRTRSKNDESNNIRLSSNSFAENKSLQSNDFSN